MKDRGDIRHQVIYRQAVGKSASADFGNKKRTTSTDIAARSAGSRSAISCGVSVGVEMRGIPSTLLNESATLFRRKYYINGSHAGFIMYMTDAAQNQEDVNNIRQAMKSAKGPGNFRNLFMYSPNGKKDGIQIIPLSEVAAKDEFLNIKNVSRDDMMAAHRVPPQMMGIIPNNTGGFGDVEKASRVFVRNELMPLQKRLQELNKWLGEEVIRFDPYTLDLQED